MNPIIQEYTVDLASNNNFLFVNTVQGDGASTRYVDITVLQYGQPYELDDVEAVIRGTKPDTSFIFNRGEIIEGAIRFEITSQMAAVPGTGYYEIALYAKKQNSVLTSFPFKIVTQKSAFNVFDLISTNEFQYLTEKITIANSLDEDVRANIAEANQVIEESREATADSIAATEESREATANAIQATNDMNALNEQVTAEEAVRVSNETERINAENNRIDAENKRVAAEEDRVDAEDARESAEDDRVSAEEARVNAENERVTAENFRIENENTREANENIRKANEIDRVNAEADRLVEEENRVTAETAREEAESARDTAEGERSDAEAVRVANENIRISNEETRKENEAARIEAENTRIANEETRVENEATRQSAYTKNMADVAQALEDTATATNKANEAAETTSTLRDDMQNKLDTGYFKGDKGDPLTFEDLTDEQIAEMSPQISIGTVESVDPEVGAHVTVERIGADNKFSFKIPRGKNASEMINVFIISETEPDGYMEWYCPIPDEESETE